MSNSDRPRSGRLAAPSQIAELEADDQALRRIEECLRRHRKDPRPGVRVSALVTILGDKPAAADPMLFALELEDPQAHNEAIDAVQPGQ